MILSMEELKKTLDSGEYAVELTVVNNDNKKNLMVSVSRINDSGFGRHEFFLEENEDKKEFTEELFKYFKTLYE